MKKIILSFIVGMLFVPTLTWGIDLVNFSIDRNLYESLSSVHQRAISSKISELDTFFTNNIYPNIPAHILEKIKNLKVTIYFSNQSGRDGLFVPGEDDHKHRIIVQLTQINSNGFKSLIAHEFFHAIHYEINSGEAPWVREGMAQLFEYIITNEFNALNLRAAIANPLTPLIADYDILNVNAAQYGHNMLYFYYLYKHCGGKAFFWNISEGVNDLKGAYLIDFILSQQESKSKECKNFSSSVVSFEVAKFHNQIQFSKSNESERFFLAPNNLSPKITTVNSPDELEMVIRDLPIYSSLKLKLEVWNNLNGQCSGCIAFYAKRSFPYEVDEHMPSDTFKNYDIILVRTKANGNAD